MILKNLRTTVNVGEDEGGKIVNKEIQVAQNNRGMEGEKSSERQMGEIKQSCGT